MFASLVLHEENFRIAKTMCRLEISLFIRIFLYILLTKPVSLNPVTEVSVTDSNTIKSKITNIPKPDSTIFNCTGVNCLEPYFANTTKRQSVVPENCPEKCEGTPLPRTEWSLTSSIKKCCEIGENFHYTNGNDTGYCGPETFPFDVDVITAEFYSDNCIMSIDEEVHLWVEALNPCNFSTEYSAESGDILYVLQNGSLLIIDFQRATNYEIFDQYCLDMDYKTGILKALVCVSSYVAHVQSSITTSYSLCLIFSICCLVLVFIYYTKIREGSTVHEISYGILSACLAIGFLLQAIAHVSAAASIRLGLAVQFFMLAYFCWIMVLCTNLGVHIWFYARLYKPLSTPMKYILITSYALFAFSVPLILVLVTRSKGLTGMPSYLSQGWSQSLQDNQRFFIPPVSGFLAISLITLIFCFCGIRQLEAVLSTQLKIQYQTIDTSAMDSLNLSRIDYRLFEQTKQDVMDISYLTSVVITLWSLEVISFYNPAAGGYYLAIMDVLNALQGVFILTILISVRKNRQTVASWWHDRYPHDSGLPIHGVELVSTDKFQGSVPQNT